MFKQLVWAASANIGMHAARIYAQRRRIIYTTVRIILIFISPNVCKGRASPKKWTSRSEEFRPEHSSGRRIAEADFIKYARL